MLNESTEKDTEIFKKKVGEEFKSLIKTSSTQYMDKLKENLHEGFKQYYEELNKCIANELLTQEGQQKDLHDKIDFHEKKLCNVCSKIEKRRIKLIHLQEVRVDIKRKSQIFNFLHNYIDFKKRKDVAKHQVTYMYKKKVMRKGLNFLKKFSFLEKTNQFEIKMAERTQNNLQTFEENLIKQKNDLMNLIIKAEEKLKHENRKKIQTKLQLDQILLRGISAINLQALHLSQNSLNGNIIIFLFHLTF
jgi:hypothetical protein